MRNRRRREYLRRAPISFVPEGELTQRSSQWHHDIPVLVGIHNCILQTVPPNWAQEHS